MRAPGFVALLSAALLVAGAQATCAGNGCEKQHDAARAAGLLGGALGTCTPKTYPQTGSLQPVTLPTSVVDLVWTALPNGTANEAVIFGLTTDDDGYTGGALWRSAAAGAAGSWLDASAALRAALPSDAGADASVGVVAVLWHDAEPAKLFIQGRGDYHFTSPDYGATFAAVRAPGSAPGGGYAQDIKTHPRRTDWLLAKARRGGCGATALRAGLCPSDLVVSKDWGTTWGNLTAAAKGRIASFRDFDWGSKIEKYAKKATPDEAVFATVQHTGRGQAALYPGWDADVHYVVSLDLFASPAKVLLPCGNLFEVLAHKIYVAVPSDCPVGPDGKARRAPARGVAGRSVTLYASDGDGDDFKEACLPANLEDDGYNLVRTHDGYGTFVLADHTEPGSRSSGADAPTSDAYAPAYNMSMFTLSLRDVYRRDFNADFSRVEALPGVFIANQVDVAALDRGTAARASYARFLRTRLSLNGGADWAPLPPPASFRYAQCNACRPGAPCALHLHGPSSRSAPEGAHPSVYSHPSAPGVLVGTGNVGAHLEFSPDATCTFLSRDGGQTWEDVADHAAIYEFGDRGGLVVRAAHASSGDPARQVLFSLDHGACWHAVNLPEAIAVDNIRAEPGGSGHVFLVHGLACAKTAAHPDCSFEGGSSPPGRMFVLDIKALMAGDWKECNTAADSPDYELWPLLRPDACLLGAKRSVTRRKRDAGCLSGAATPPPEPAPEPCECSAAADAECEYGWERGANATCAPIAGLQPDACPSFGSGCYRPSATNLRLVHADVCTSPESLFPDTNGRGHRTGGGGGKGGGGGGSGVRAFFVTVLLAGILLSVAGVVWAHCLSVGARGSALEAAAPVLGVLGAAAEAALDLVITAWDWLRAKLGGLSARRDAEAAYFEPLNDGASLDLDPEDHTSPPLFPGR